MKTREPFSLVRSPFVTKMLLAWLFPHAKSHRLRTIEEIWRFALELMDAAESASAGRRPGKFAALEFRNGLTLGFLAHVPIRRSNLAAAGWKNTLGRQSPRAVI